MSGRIITVRHGRPNLARDMKITAREYGDWWARYDESGLHPDERPPASLLRIADGVENVFSSTLPRAIETARWVIGEARTAPADVMFVEAPLPPPPVPFVKLKPGTWGVISRSFWFWGYAPKGVENHRATWRRVHSIADRLAEAAKDGDVLLCAHGYLNWMIDRRLRRNGWRLAERDGGNHYWSWRIYEPTGSRAATPSRAATQHSAAKLGAAE